MKAAKLAVIAMTSAFFLAACGQVSQTPNTAPKNSNKPAPSASPAIASDPSTPTEVAGGDQLYADNCQICHQQSGKGGKNLTIKGKKISPADLTSDKFKKRSDQDLVKGITEGAEDDGMPAFKGKLTPDQLKEIVQYLRKLQGPTAAAM